jgi:hypothetical protein
MSRGYSPTFAIPTVIDSPELDSYASRGVAISRDGASIIAAALRRDAFEMRTRGGEANIAAAEQQEALAKSIGKSLNS